MLKIRPTELSDEIAFLKMTQSSRLFHYPWINAPQSSEEFLAYIHRCQQPNQRGFLVTASDNTIVGVFNISEIVYRAFCSAYLGFYAAKDFAGQGLMSQGLKLLLNEAFVNLKLHRLEANIQPENVASINLVKKNGFHKEGFSEKYLKINDKWCDHERWAITLERWNKCI